MESGQASVQSDDCDPGSGDPAQITLLLDRASQGDPAAAADLLPLVYQQLRNLARAKMTSERPDQTLQATELVHEAYLRLVGGGEDKADWQGRWHFFAAAAEAMRRILVERARRRGRLNRGGGRRRVNLSEVDFDSAAVAASSITVDDPPEELLALDEALTELLRIYPREAQIVKLRYFAGLTIEQAARATGVSVPTANRSWAFAKAWLFRRIKAPG
jgi:RNA polymerase sigma factor (TIGR02999 family)